MVENGFDVVAVITSPDKPSGRGKKLTQSPVKKYALQKGLKIMQPTNLKNKDFQKELAALQADLQVVVAFRMLPASVFDMPPLGSINLHASLLPQYRGAAPINWAVINGEKETGLTTFFIAQKIDTGALIYQEKVAIGEKETAGELHDRLMNTGAKLILKTVQAIDKDDYPKIPQIMPEGELKKAPKIFPETCKIDWSKPVDEIHNFIRGLNPYPAAYTFFEDQKLKIFTITKTKVNHSEEYGKIISDHKKYLKIACKDGFLDIIELQLQGRKRMDIVSFLNGYKNELPIGLS